MSDKEFQLDFIGVGARKSGTTWLSQCLDEHPEIAMARSKETNFFLSEKFIKEMSNDPVLGDPVRFIKISSLKQLKREFNSKRPSKIIGEFSPYYLYEPSTAHRIYSHNPKSKIIVILRNPIETIYSNYWFDRSSGQLGFPQSFEQALEEFPHYTEWMYYSRLLKPFLRAFSDVHIILHDDIKSDSSKVLRELYTFLGVDPTFKPPSLGKKVNSSQEVRFKFFAVIGRFLAKVFLILKLRVLIDSLFSLYALLNKKNVSYPKMSEVTSKRLKGLFADDIKELEKLLGRNLSHWYS